MTQITNIIAREIMDSRGFPTIEADIILETGEYGRASVPSGASTGAYEAHELRDQDPDRFSGKGVLKAIEHIEGEIYNSIGGLDVENQTEIDMTLIELDGSKNKSRLGANAMLAVSLAALRAASNTLNIPLYQYIGGFNARHLPVPQMNILNGGAHADNLIDIQEFMILPIGANQFKEALKMGVEVFYALKACLSKQGLSTNVGDEGGFAPKISSAEKALELISNSIEDAGYQLGKDIYLGLDVAATEFYQNGVYVLKGEGKTLHYSEMIDYLENLVNQFPIFSIEDGLSEDDLEGWKELTKRLGNSCQLVGDDLFVTNPLRLKTGIEQNLANALLVKPNQIGTVSETIEAIMIAHQAGYQTVMSHRSGETEDHIISDLAVGCGCCQIKTGSLSRSDRLSKYNQLLRIEEDIGQYAIYSDLKNTGNRI